MAITVGRASFLPQQPSQPTTYPVPPAGTPEGVPPTAQPTSPAGVAQPPASTTQPPQQESSSSSSSVAAPYRGDRRSQIQDAYRSSLGRDATEADLMSWMGNDDFARQIAGSAEAQAHGRGETYQRDYNPMGGWVEGKLDDPKHQSVKYQYGRAVQEWGTPTRGNLEPLVQYFNARYGAQARVVGPDQIDFGDGYGPVDVIQASHTDNPLPWFNPIGEPTGETRQKPYRPVTTPSAPGSIFGLPAGAQTSSIDPGFDRDGLPFDPSQIKWADDWQDRVLPEGTEPGLVRGEGGYDFTMQPVTNPDGSVTFPGIGTITPDGQFTPDPGLRHTMGAQGTSESPASAQTAAATPPSPSIPGMPGGGISGGGTSAPPAPGAPPAPPPPTSSPAPPAPTTQIGGDPMSRQIDSTLDGLLRSGTTPFGGSIMDRLNAVLNQGGMTPVTRERLIGAREDSARAFKGMLSDAEGALADRGLISSPGVAQGPHAGAIGRISEAIAPDFADAMRDIETHALDESNQSFMQALQMATGMSTDQARTMLSAVGSGTDRQSALAQIALQSLSLNMDWNRFLAEHSLNQQKLLNDIQQGRLDTLIPLLEEFLKGAGTSAGGHI